MRWISIAVAAVVACTWAGIAFAAAHHHSASTVKVALAPGGNDSKLQPTPTVTKAGKVTFLVKNYSHDRKEYGVFEAAEAHELVVLRTNLPPNKLKTDKAGFAIETGRVGKPVALDPGKSGSITLTLPAGNYVLICNLQGHYGAGQYTALKVVR